jgi:hypothetical protein
VSRSGIIAVVDSTALLGAAFVTAGVALVVL